MAISNYRIVANQQPEEITMLKEYLQVVPTELLVEAASGRIDLNELARAELRSRGLDNNGQWAGFSKNK